MIEDVLELPPAPEGEEMVFDYASLGLTLRSHPMALLRFKLAERPLLTIAEMKDFPDGRLARACGILTMRQQPSTSNGVVLVTLEDETGTVNVIVWRSLHEQQRQELLHSRLLAGMRPASRRVTAARIQHIRRFASGTSWDFNLSQRGTVDDRQRSKSASRIGSLWPLLVAGVPQE